MTNRPISTIVGYINPLCYKCDAVSCRVRDVATGATQRTRSMSAEPIDLAASARPRRFLIRRFRSRF
ncbi:hypothetical protein EVAR_30921_1 [Eumeta japonica]|uniref:Uncharacterized protein n=1 Tax=Eumeta variegata TaxID=151549 RepID=A0A4C1V3H5_EUMVA|nr:hypothetical protein EVAR_30921_1 [Eumeta japonica]